jgi:hypothetical protein
MSGIDFNNSSEFIKEFKIFNKGNAGIVQPVQIRIERKKPEDKEKAPDYKLFAFDDSGEVNEGFYYFENAEENGFKNYQAQKLILLAKGVMGDDVKFPFFSTPREGLDQIMLMVAKASKGKYYRIITTYGTNKKPSMYLGFKNFGGFIQPVDVANTLELDSGDNIVRAARINSPSTDEEINAFVADSFAPNPIIDPQPDKAMPEKDDLPF